MWNPANDATLERMFHQGGTYTQLARHFRVTRNVIAGRCNRLGIVRQKKPAPERHPPKPRAFQPPNTEQRKKDQRDLDILYDIQEGHRQSDVAKYWGVSTSFVCDLEKARREAN